MKLKHVLFCGALGALLSVAIGAFGAHGLKAVLSVKELGWISTATQYQMYHSLALVALSALMLSMGESRLLLLSCYSFILGILLFSGSLYLLAAIGSKWLVFFTPLGGVAFIIGWLLLMIGAFRLQAGRDN